MSTGRWSYAELETAATGEGPFRLALCLSASPGTPFEAGQRLLFVGDELRVGTAPAGWDLAPLVQALRSLRGDEATARVLLEGPGGKAAFFLEGLIRRGHLVVAGRGHVGMALGRFARLLGWRITFVDERPEVAPVEADPDEGFHLVDYGADPFAAVDELDGAALVIVTHKHRGDQTVLRAALDLPFAYVGMIGSRRKTSLIRQNLLDEGIPSERLDQVAMPVGVANGGQSPEEIALGILDEIVAVRNGVQLEALRPASVIWRQASDGR